MGSVVSAGLGGALLAPPPLPSLNPVKDVTNQFKWAEGDVKQATGQQNDSAESEVKAQTDNFEQPVKKLLGD